MQQDFFFFNNLRMVLILCCVSRVTGSTSHVDPDTVEVHKYKAARSGSVFFEVLLFNVVNNACKRCDCLVNHDF